MQMVHFLLKTFALEITSVRPLGRLDLLFVASMVRTNESCVAVVFILFFNLLNYISRTVCFLY